MKKKDRHLTTIFTFVLLIVLTSIFYTTPVLVESDKVFLTISTFLFTIFTGFFISRQGARYSKLRETVAALDGKFTNIYRVSGHIGAVLQTDLGKVITEHYQRVVETGLWDYHFTHKSSTITSMHNLLDRDASDEKLSNIKNQSLGAIIKSLGDAQDLRKQMVALREERIPHFQWVLIYFFMVILLATVASLGSYGQFFPAILKAAFAVSVVSVIIILHKLDSLRLFEGTIGEHSAQDVLGIINGEK